MWELVLKLQQEAQQVDVERRLILRGISPKKKKVYKTLQKVIFTMWDKFDRSKDYKLFLRSAAHVSEIEPVTDGEDD